jgi:hypothetical protein
MNPEEHPSTLNHLGHIGYILLFSGQFLLAHHITYGWGLRILGEALWLYVGIRMKMSSIWFWGAAGLCFESYGLWRWVG